MLERMRVDVIEAGFPIASPAIFRSVRAVAAGRQEPAPCVVWRAPPMLISTAPGEALKGGGGGPGFIPSSATSPIHMQMKLGCEPDQVVERAVEAVRRARRWTDDVEFSAGGRGAPNWISCAGSPRR